MRDGKAAVWIGILCALPFLGGCAVWRAIVQNGEPKDLPKLLVLPFDCDNSQIGQDITKGFVSQLDSDEVQAMDVSGFQTYLSSRAAQAQRLRLLELPKSSAAALAPAPAPSAQALVANLAKSVAAREKLYHDTGIQYLAYGKAKEQAQGALELGNLKTAETAEIRLLKLETQEVIADESFQQGSFEIVAPDRIGSKLAALANRKLKEIRKQAQAEVQEPRESRRSAYPY